MPTKAALLKTYLRALREQRGLDYQLGAVGAVMCYCLKWSGVYPDMRAEMITQDHEFCDLADFFAAGREVEQQDV